MRKHLLGLALICLLSLLLIRIMPAGIIYDEHWQSGWQSRWTVLSGGVYTDSAGLHATTYQGATLKYIGSYMNPDHSATVEKTCGGYAESPLTLDIGVRSDGTYGYWAEVTNQQDEVGWSAVSMWAVTPSGTYGLGSTYTNCQTSFKLTANGSSITLWQVGYGYPLLEANDSALTTGTVGLWLNNGDGAVSRVLIEGADTTPPTAPTNLTAAAPSATQINLSWTASTDQGSGMSYYKVRRGGNDYATVYAPTTTYSDTNLQPDSTFTYTVLAVDREGNVSAASNSATATTLSPSNLRPEGLGKSPLAAYYGSGPELVNLESGNLVLSFPLIPIQGRTGGTSPGLQLVYNSQVWSRDASGVQYTAVDGGYGAGWSLWLGAMYPVYAAGVIDHYRFIDSSGATHRLYPSTGDTYVSRDSTYLKWDRVLHRLWFRNGTFWDFDYVSLDPEPDAGTRYPTKIQDTNGNYVTISYLTGARINDIHDSRHYDSVYDTTDYHFVYVNNRLDSIHEITTLRSWPYGQTDTKRFSFVYQEAQLSSPFPVGPTVNVKLIQQVKRWGQGSTPTITHSIEYNSSGEPTKLTLPYGAYFRYTWQTGSFSGGAVQRREVASRIYSASASGTPAVEKTEYFQHPDDSAYAGHTQCTINDAAGNRKIWYFTQGEALGWKNGLQWKQEVYQGAGVTLLRTFRTDWTQDQPAVAELRNPRPSAQRTIFNDVTPNLESRREQDVDANGNVTQVREFGYGDSSPYRTLTVTYLTGSDYNSRNILDRVTGTTLYAGAAGGTILRQTGMGYDVPGSYSNITPAPNMHDSSYDVSMRFRGNPTVTAEANRSKTTYYDILGNARVVVDSLGSVQTASYSANTGYTVPSSTNSSTPLGTSMVWNGDLTLSSASAASGESVSYSWDSAKRPSSQTSPSGSQTTYSYNDLGTPPTVVQTTQVHTGGGPPNYTLATGTYSITRTLDGLGRVVLVQDSRTNAYVKYEYDACSCSPTGRQTKVSNPYLSSETPLWTISEYDALGRLTRVTAPDGSATTTSYAGNTTTVTDPAGKRKKFTYDAFGNMTQVAEPDAQGNLTVLTNYTYDTQSRLLTVSMNGGTQTRSFSYNQYGQVTSATNPENGTVTYSYNNDGTLHSKTDARNQTVLFEYDTYKRVTRIYGSGSSYEKRFYYDGYPSDQGEHTTGRLAAMEWEMPGAPPYTWQTHYWRHVFSYSTYGAVTGSKLVDCYDASGYGDYVESTMAADFAWTMQGELWWVRYLSERQLYYSFDSAGRPSGLTAYANWDESPYNPNYWTMKNLVTGTAFNKAGQMTSLTAYGGSETRTYDPTTLQLTGMQVPGALDLSYMYPAAPNNNGRISAETNNLTSTQVSYTYDQLNRLATAVSASGGTTNWGLGFSYDVYGNRTGQTVTAGSAPAFSATFGSNNRMVGYSYDNNGNQLNTADGATLEYDEENRLKKWTKQGQTQEYIYHPSGWRLSNSNEGWYFYGPGGQLLTKAATCYTDYVYFAGRLLYTMSGGSLDPRLTKLTRIYGDRLGSTRATAVLTYGGGSTTRNYYPFGEEIGSTANDQYKFASTYRDSSTGLDYAMMRYYTSGTGRFLSVDPYRASGGPADPQGLNRYTYAQNDPVNFRDPTGLLRCGDDEQGCEPQEADPDALGGLTTCLWVPISQGLLGSGVWVCSGNSSNQLGTPRPAPKRKVATYLAVANDCYWAQGSGASATYTRVITYQVLDQDHQKFYGSEVPTVSENVETTSGAEVTGGGVWTRSNNSMRPDGTFDDFYSANGKGLSTATQTFQSNGMFLTVEIGAPRVRLRNVYDNDLVFVNNTASPRPCVKGKDPEYTF
jgi:RHS repeat-associated protein